MISRPVISAHFGCEICREDPFFPGVPSANHAGIEL
jgi:hypothetical protein